jgi:hypothetical protein
MSDKNPNHRGGRRRTVGFLFALPVVILSACTGKSGQWDDRTTWSLYRSNAADGLDAADGLAPSQRPGAQAHVATFDANEWSDSVAREAGNARNCRFVADIMQKQDGENVRYWCEQGRARK